MDVRKMSFVLAFFFLGCAENESGGSKFKTSSNDECRSRTVSGEYLVKRMSGKVELIYADDQTSAYQQAIEKSLDPVEYFEPNYQISSINKNHISTKGTDSNWGVNAIQAKKLWDENIKGEDVIVAVIDTGTDLTHPQLTKQAWKNHEEINGLPGVDDDDNGFVDDINGWNFTNGSPENYDEVGHGTHVAGTIAADHEEGSILGVAPRTKIMALDFMTQFGGSDAGAIGAIDYAIQKGAHIVNASWGSTRCSQTIQDKFVELTQAGVFVAVAAGNDGENLSFFPQYPAVYDSPSQITVGASTIHFLLAYFSNYGDPVHLVAPGKDIESTVPFELSSSGKAFMNGTSMATPHVAGAAALLLSAKPDATYAEIKSAMLTTVHPGNFDVRHNGEIRVDLALEKLLSP